MNYILVPDSETRKAFDVVSILKCKFPNCKLLLGNTDGSKPMSLHLKHLFKEDVVILRTNNIDDCIIDFLTISNKYHLDNIVFVPIEENTIECFLKFISIYGVKNYKFILPSESIYNIARNKKLLNVFCNNNKLSAPKCYNIEDISSLEDKEFPILLKPCVGSGSEGQFRLYNSDEYTLKIRDIVSKKPYLVQELIDNGHDVQGAFYLYHNGALVEAYSHERIRTSPPSGGVTVLSKLKNNDKLIIEGIKILAYKVFGDRVAIKH